LNHYFLDKKLIYSVASLKVKSFKDRYQCDTKRSKRW